MLTFNMVMARPVVQRQLRWVAFRNIQIKYKVLDLYISISCISGKRYSIGQSSLWRAILPDGQFRTGQKPILPTTQEQCPEQRVQEKLTAYRTGWDISNIVLRLYPVITGTLSPAQECLTLGLPWSTQAMLAAFCLLICFILGTYLISHFSFLQTFLKLSFLSFLFSGPTIFYPLQQHLRQINQSVAYERVAVQQVKSTIMKRGLLRLSPGFATNSL